MTKRSKCEVCRARKIKCDEARPNCGPCEKKGRTCVYKNENDAFFVHEQFPEVPPSVSAEVSSASTSRSSSYRSDSTEKHLQTARPSQDVTLRLKRSHKAETGSGEFLMFGRPRRQHPRAKVEPSPDKDDHDAPKATRGRATLSPSPPSFLSRPQDSEASKWMSVAGPGVLHLNPLGDWVRLAWDRVGCNGYLDIALEYCFAAITEFRHRHQKNTVKISTIGSSAMRSLRHAIESGTNCIDVYVAIMLHYAAEHFRGMKSYYWVTHMSAVSQLLASRKQDFHDRETVQSILFILRDDEVGEAILNGQVSLLEDKIAPTAALGSLELEIAVNELDRLYVKLPRLVLLVRAARVDSSSSAAVKAATELALELHQSDGTLTIRRTIDNILQRARSEPTTLSSVPVPTSLYFSDASEFMLATRYFIFQALLAGLVQKICDLAPMSSTFDRSAVEAEDTWAGSSMFQCVQWAFETDALTKLRMAIVLQLGYGVWDRLEKRQLSSGSPEYERAVRMKAGTIELTNEIEVLWDSKLTTHQRIWQICEMFAGGPLHEWMYDYRSPSGYAMTQQCSEGAAPA